MNFHAKYARQYLEYLWSNLEEGDRAVRRCRRWWDRLQGTAALTLCATTLGCAEVAAEDPDAALEDDASAAETSSTDAPKDAAQEINYGNVEAVYSAPGCDLALGHKRTLNSTATSVALLAAGFWWRRRRQRRFRRHFR